jgi:tetratricopeptide (TPR) repeat protein
LTIGDLYSSATLYKAAERWYRRAATIDPKQYERLALSLAQQGRVKEAITLCAGAAGSDKSSRPAVTLASILVRTQPTPEDFKQADPILNKAAADHKDDANLLISLANLRILQNRPDEACQLYRRVLDAQPKHVVALNNLATLLAEQPGKGALEAIQRADSAIELVGPQPGLLDTKATALLYAGKPGEAAAILGEAISSPNPDPRYYLHLAAACDRLGEAGRAREALARAERGELTRQLLTDGDRRILAELSKKFR